MQCPKPNASRGQQESPQSPQESYPNLLILRTSRKELPVRAETDAPNVEIAVLVHRLVLERSNVMTRINIEDLRRTVAARSKVLAIAAEADTANHAVVYEVMN